MMRTSVVGILLAALFVFSMAMAAVLTHGHGQFDLTQNHQNRR